MTWGTFILAIVLSIFWPITAIYVIIAFDIYWILRVTYLLIFMLISWFKYRQHRKIDWWQKLKTEKSNWPEYYHLIFYLRPVNRYQWLIILLKNLTNNHYDQKN